MSVFLRNQGNRVDFRGVLPTVAVQRSICIRGGCFLVLRVSQKAKDPHYLIRIMPA